MKTHNNSKQFILNLNVLTYIQFISNFINRIGRFGFLQPGVWTFVFVL